MKNLSPTNQIYLGIAVLVVGVFAFSGTLEIIAAIAGALIVVNAQQKKRRGQDED